MALGLPGVGTIGEYAVYDLIPRVRVRYPLGELFETYVAGGVGPTYAEFNDRPTGHEGPRRHPRRRTSASAGSSRAGLRVLLHEERLGLGRGDLLSSTAATSLRIEDVTHSGNHRLDLPERPAEGDALHSGARVPSWLTL
jgi:hypothetical protein